MAQKSNSSFSRFLREPLIHFLALGAGLFVLYAIVNEETTERPDRIVVDEAQVMRLAEQFQRIWMRPPTRQELRGLAEDYVKEEVLYREAVALGLDQDDLVIRRRMRQKMEFLNTDLVEQRAPTDAELQAYLNAHADKFRRLERFSFEQIYFNPERSGSTAEQRAAELLVRLRDDLALAAATQSLGDPTLLPPGAKDASAREIASVFGTALTAAIVQTTSKRWSGPYPSAYGLHLVRLSKRTGGGMPVLNEVRPIVAREWANERRQEANERSYQALRDRYAVEIRLPAATELDNLAVRRR